MLDETAHVSSCTLLGPSISALRSAVQPCLARHPQRGQSMLPSSEVPSMTVSSRRKSRVPGDRGSLGTGVPRRRVAGLVVLGSGSGDEAVASTRNSLDIAGLMPVVLKLRAEGTHVAVHDVALDHEVGTPKGVEDLLAGEDAPRVRREKIKQRLLERGEVQLVFAGQDLAVEDIDLELADTQPRHERPR